VSERDHRRERQRHALLRFQSVRADPCRKAKCDQRCVFNRPRLQTSLTGPLPVPTSLESNPGSTLLYGQVPKYLMGVRFSSMAEIRT